MKLIHTTHTLAEEYKNPDGNSGKVKCINNIDYVGKTVTVKATVGNSTGECLLTVIGGV